MKIAYLARIPFTVIDVFLAVRSTEALHTAALVRFSRDLTVLTCSPVLTRRTVALHRTHTVSVTVCRNMLGQYQTWVKIELLLKLWPNGLASRRKFWTCVPFGHPLAWTCDDLRSLTLVELKFGRK